MGIDKQEKVLRCINDLIKHADKELLKRADSKSKLIEGLSNELFFIGAFTKAELKNQIIPYMEENASTIYLMKEYVLKNPATKKEIILKEQEAPAAKKNVTMGRCRSRIKRCQLPRSRYGIRRLRQQLEGRYQRRLRPATTTKKKAGVKHGLSSNLEVETKLAIR